ncbi:MAG: hypothetical protein IJQ31_15550 [Thermoguttaceae bacterium]|nr:hypothetical protein [Thermoguttaceae bacterium]
MEEINFEELFKLGIPNLRKVSENGVRGESLSQKSNKKFLEKMTSLGITTILDLRTSDHSDRFGGFCRHNGLEYFHFPIDKAQTDCRTIIDNLPKMIDLMNNSRFYIACAQGLHRTDIALALTYVFDRKKTVPPMMYGHVRESHLREEDIARRLNSVFENLTDEDRVKLGLENFTLEEFKSRKKQLLDFSRQDVE